MPKTGSAIRSNGQSTVCRPIMSPKQLSFGVLCSGHTRLFYNIACTRQFCPPYKTLQFGSDNRDLVYMSSREQVAHSNGVLPAQVPCGPHLQARALAARLETLFTLGLMKHKGPLSTQSSGASVHQYENARNRSGAEGRYARLLLSIERSCRSSTYHVC